MNKVEEINAVDIAEILYGELWYSNKITEILYGELWYSNKITEIPKEIAKLVNLRSLHLTNNPITDFSVVDTMNIEHLRK